MKCGKCNAMLKEKEGTLFGERVKTFVCGGCSNKIIPLKEAIRVQEKVIPKVETTRKLFKFGHSTAMTLPKELKTVFRSGERVRVYFDPKEMELVVKKD